MFMSSSQLLKLVAALGLSTLLLGCHTKPLRPPVESVPLSEVLNAVKDELSSYMLSSSTVTPGRGRCFDPKGKPMWLAPTKATVVLKVVDAKQNEGSIGLTAPVGVVKFDPGVGASISESATQTLTIPLNVVAGQATRPPASGDYPIAAALGRLRDELLKVDHDRTPCLKFEEKSPIKLNLSFEVVKKGSAGFSLNLLVFKVSDKLTTSSATTQTLELELALTGSQLLILPQ